MIELLEHLNTLMSTNHLGDMHGNLFQKIFFFDNLFCVLAFCIFMIGMAIDIILKYRIRRYKNILSRRNDYDRLDPDRA